MKKNRLRFLALIFILFLVVPLSLHIFTSYSPMVSNGFVDIDSIHSSTLVSHNSSQWLKDTGFDYPSGNWSSSVTGDSTDVNASINGGEAKLGVTGDIRTYSNITGVPKIGDWTPTNNTELKLDPDYYTINSKGCVVSHSWADPNNPKQLVAIQWDRNVSLPVDMTDYNITSVSLSAIANATVHSINGATGGIEVAGEQQSGSFYANATGDFVRFYIYISDIYKTEEHEIAFLQPTDLGADNGQTYDYMSDTNLTIVSEDNIRNLMRSVLELDPEHETFTFSLGILILSEDDFDSDSDIWDELVINQCNFSFTYEKLIDQLSGISWNQQCNKISDLSSIYYVQVTNATLNFLYKIDQPWPVSSSPSSEIRALINNNPYIETVKLGAANGSYQAFSAYGNNVVGLLGDQVNFSIQLYLRDEFELNRTITVSIDNVSLIIFYNFLTIEKIPQIFDLLWPIVLILAIVLVGVGSYFIAYQTYLKYPKLVRKIRGLRRKVRKGRSLTKSISVNSRKRLVGKNLKEKMKVLRIEPEVERAGVTLNKPQVTGKIDNLNKLQERRK